MKQSGEQHFVNPSHENARITDNEIIGEEPYREFYETFESSGKLMEVVYLENNKQFEVYIQNLPEGSKVPGETTELFRIVTKKVQKKADELNEPVRFVLDPVVEVIKKWAKTKAADVIHGWDKVDADEGRFEKIFYPTNKN